MNISPTLIVAGSLAVVAGVSILVVAKNFLTSRPSESRQSDDTMPTASPVNYYNADRSETSSEYATPRSSFSGGKRKSKRKKNKKSSKRV